MPSACAGGFRAFAREICGEHGRKPSIRKPRAALRVQRAPLAEGRLEQRGRTGGGARGEARGAARDVCLAPRVELSALARQPVPSHGAMSSRARSASAPAVSTVGHDGGRGAAADIRAGAAASSTRPPITNSARAAANARASWSTASRGMCATIAPARSGVLPRQKSPRPPTLSVVVSSATKRDASMPAVSRLYCKKWASGDHATDAAAAVVKARDRRTAHGEQHARQHGRTLRR